MILYFIEIKSSLPLGITWPKFYSPKTWHSGWSGHDMNPQHDFASCCQLPLPNYPLRPPREPERKKCKCNDIYAGMKGRKPDPQTLFARVTSILEFFLANNSMVRFSYSTDLVREKERDMPSTWSIPINIIIFGIAEDDVMEGGVWRMPLARCQNHGEI